jgi:hypothetical protein
MEIGYGSLDFAMTESGHDPESFWDSYAAAVKA